MITLADKVTIARLFVAPLAVAGYLFLPTDYNMCFWVCGILCAVAELTDLFDGMIARARGEVSDFGKLADPFCDVFYRIFLFIILLLPAAGVGYPIELHMMHDDLPFAYWLYLPPVYVIEHGESPVYGCGLFPVLPVLIMTLREIIAGALRSMAASKGLILAARQSGKVKAWVQGVTIITACGMPAFFVGPSSVHLIINSAFCWVCAILSTYSIIEYFIVNKAVLKELIQRKPLS
ncbi:MAG: CDP-alcohol phosphatidyltransferase family protein [Planctomycetes bacterium]|nr:CDP-alcohol phosphatidyltransferase family protein [Planctomycetota bacterium]